MTIFRIFITLQKMHLHCKNSSTNFSLLWR